MLNRAARQACRYSASLLCMLLLQLAFAGSAKANLASDGPSAESISLPAEVIVRALSLMGITYRWGGNLPETGMDCSGFVRHVFHEAAGLVLPRKSEEMSRAATSIGREYLLPGDLVFFNTQRRGFSHVGIYLGDDKFVHAPAKGKSIRIDSMGDRYWVRRFDGARRVMGELPSQDPAALDQLIDRTLARIGVPLHELEGPTHGSGSPSMAGAGGGGLFAGAQWRRQAAAAQAYLEEQRPLPNAAMTVSDQRISSGPASRPSLIPAIQQQASKLKAKPHQGKPATKPNQRKAKAAQRAKATRA
ncbi:MAG: peptidoglycan endopeptidase [Betaproteobacteria bacterium]|jgi:NlpC/P60 family|nr:C40 family peptidase [Pseudomonadota bacterium]NBO03316.1 peptidoglycan endopeptidase [Betaproteobacteria bacterium]NBO95250.1 peptidoglycan endopeptidase [Betaproteobacteria bacterium]NBP35087.1 peptidoglycan endopeptidase [Betaproteobacteria bacterium]NBP37436.1 peptidoglycan endopeptidase [Betaproteobacteria bacterium]